MPLCPHSARPRLTGLCALLVIGLATLAQAADSAPVATGQRIFTCGHSFHAFYIAPILADMAQAAGITGHQVVGVSKIGGSQVIAHWYVPDASNQAKTALRAGAVDVLTLSPMHNPDVGIFKFAELAGQVNPAVRVTVQEFWMPWDKNEWPYQGSADQVDNNRMTVEGLKALHDPYFAAMDAYVRGVNARLGRQEVFVVPVGQAVNALRGKVIAGAAPGIARQSDLFTDKLGHPMPTVQALAGYCHFAVIYRRSPVGLPMPPVLSGSPRDFTGTVIAGAQRWDAPLNRLLQELAWNAVISHPLSGVQAAAQAR